MNPTASDLIAQLAWLRELSRRCWETELKCMPHYDFDTEPEREIYAQERNPWGAAAALLEGVHRTLSVVLQTTDEWPPGVVDPRLTPNGQLLDPF